MFSVPRSFNSYCAFGIHKENKQVRGEERQFRSALL